MYATYENSLKSSLSIPICWLHCIVQWFFQFLPLIMSILFVSIPKILFCISGSILSHCSNIGSQCVHTKMSDIWVQYNMLRIVVLIWLQCQMEKTTTSPIITEMLFWYCSKSYTCWYHLMSKVEHTWPLHKIKYWNFEQDSWHPVILSNVETSFSVFELSFKTSME